MDKVTVTIGKIGDKFEVIAGPNSDLDGQKKALRDLVDAGGNLPGKGKGVVSDAYIIHTTKGRVVYRKDMPGSKASHDARSKAAEKERKDRAAAEKKTDDKKDG